MSADRYRIVAEVTRSWPVPEFGHEPLLSQKFEEVISINLLRGYDLESWQYHPLFFGGNGGGTITETIIAVFVKRWDPATGEKIPAPPWDSGEKIPLLRKTPKV